MTPSLYTWTQVSLRAAAVASAGLLVLALATACGTPNRNTSESGAARASQCDAPSMQETLNTLEKSAAQAPSGRSSMIVAKANDLEAIITRAGVVRANANGLERVACATVAATAALYLADIPLGVGGQTKERALAAADRARGLAANVSTACTALTSDERARSDGRRCALGAYFEASTSVLSALPVYRAAAADSGEAPDWDALRIQAENWGSEAEAKWEGLTAQLSAQAGAFGDSDVKTMVNDRLTIYACNLQNAYASILEQVDRRLRQAPDRQAALQALTPPLTLFQTAHQGAAAKAATALKLAATPPESCAAGGDPRRCTRDLNTALTVRCLQIWGVGPAQ
jgi:hypothetical protein